MSANTSNSRNGNEDGCSAAAATAGHIAVQIAEGSGHRQERWIPANTDSAVSGSAAMQQCAINNTPADMGHMPASLHDNLLASDCLMDEGGSASDCCWQLMEDTHTICWTCARAKALQAVLV
jgi:hypothetical protein